MKKANYYLVIAEYTRDLRNPDKLEATNHICHEVYDNTDEALVKAKRVIQNRMLEESKDTVYTKWYIDNIDYVTVDKLMGNGITYYQEVRDDHTNNFYEGYACIIERDVTFKDTLKDTFSWFLAFLFWPVVLVNGIIRAYKITHNYPVDVVEKYTDELKTTPIMQWYKVYNKYFDK